MSKRTKPARLACGTGPDLQSVGADASRVTKPPSQILQAPQLARRAVEEMADCGAVFRVQRRADNLPGWTYELPDGGGDREACRQIIKDAKQRGGTFWAEFVRAIIETAGRAPQ